MRTLVFGGTGMLGGATVRAARRRGWAALGLGRGPGDVTDRRAVDSACAAFRPELVVNCAAFTQVDRCESEREHAMAVNGAAVGHLAAAAARHGAKLVQISTDYVFAGDATTPYAEDAPLAPRSAYGSSKAAGEEQALAAAGALVVRTSWLFGAGGPNFVRTMLSLVEQEKLPLRVVDDQVGCPTYVPFLAAAVLDLAARGAAGVVHYCNREPVSWYELARAIVHLAAPEAPVVAVKTVDFPRPAPRPAYSVLAVARAEKLLGRRVEPWLLGLALYLDHLRQDRAAGTVNARPATVPAARTPPPAAIAPIRRNA